MTEEKQKAQFHGNIFDLQIFQTFGNLETRFDINLSKYLSSLKFLKLNNTFLMTSDIFWMNCQI